MGDLGDGLPRTRSEWPTEVLEAAAQFACGDVVEGPPYFYFANPAYAVLERTKRYAPDSQGPEIIDASRLASPFGIITSQTCDVGEIDFDPPSKPFIMVAPVFEGSHLEGGLRKLLQAKPIGPFLHLPELAKTATGFWVADFRLEMPVEKSWLVGRTPIKGFGDEEDSHLVPRVVAALRNRPAWDNRVQKAVGNTLSEALKSLKKDDSELYYSVQAAIDEFGVRADSRLTPTWIQVTAFYRSQLPKAVREWWTLVGDRILEAAHNEGLVVHAFEAVDLDSYPVSRYRKFATVNLSRYSPE